MAYLGEEIKKLGFGLMRLPRKGESEEIDVEQTTAMVDKFMAAGFTYFDTAWAYPGSEEAIREALVKRYPRESYQLTTKNAPWIESKTREEATNQLNISLERTGAGYFDFYLLHNLGEQRTKVFDDFDMWSFVAEKKKEGVIRHFGFSFHSTPEELEEILIAHPEAEFVQLQINYADWENPAIQSRGCYEVARKYNKPIIIMEPIKGGMLATPPENVRKVFEDTGSNASVASWAVRFAASLDGVITVLSGMSNVEQMEDNISYMTDFKPLSESEQAVIEKARTELQKYPIIPCTTCDYCAKVCPVGIGISGTFTSMNYLTLYGNKKLAQGQVSWLVDKHDKKRATECVKCGLCEKACPQHIKIREQLEYCAKELA